MRIARCILTAAPAVAMLLTGGLLVASAAPKPNQAVSATLENNGKAVRIVFKNGQSLVVAMKDSDAVSFDTPIISDDRRTVAWTEEAQVAASYPDTMFLYVFRDGAQVKFVAPDSDGRHMGGCPYGGATLDWNLLASGRQLYEACGFAHGQPSEYRNLYDLGTGRLLGTVQVDNDTGKPPVNAPAWAKRPRP